MGNWNINIQGIGNLDDANALAKKFVGDMIKAGHQVSRATFFIASHDILANVEAEQCNTVRYIAESSRKVTLDKARELAQAIGDELHLDPAGVPSTVLPPSKE
jgi:hypothetical protein